jgi:uncharacterized protein (TIGR02001 family)
MPARQCCGSEVVRRFTVGAVICTAFLLAAFALENTGCRAADVWGGSVGLTSDYLVRGISRTDDQEALQLDLHYSGSSGLLAGVFASNTQIDSREPRDAELSGFLGFGWNMGSDWHSKIMVSHYAYPWNRHGSHYNYDELNLDTAYQGWLHVNIEYSPNAPRFLPYPYESLTRLTEKSAEISAQRQIWGKLSGIAGIGYSFLDGPNSGGYTYWSAGAAYEWRALSAVAAYVNTSSEAKLLFPNEAATGRWTGTLLWRF